MPAFAGMTNEHRTPSRRKSTVSKAGIQARWRSGLPLSESVDFLRVGVAAALVAAVRDDSERGQACPERRRRAPRLQRRCDGTRLALVRSSCRHRLSTLSFAGIKAGGKHLRGLDSRF